jgi:hypothetical protein
MTTELTPISRGIRLTWWIWVLIFASLLLCALLAVLMSFHNMGRNEYQQVITELKAHGKIATVDEFIARAPAVDVDAQEAWDRWSKPMVMYPRDHPAPVFDRQTWTAYVMGTASLPNAIQIEINDNQLTMQPAVELLNNKHLIISVFGWIAQDCPPGKRFFLDTARTRMPNLLSTRSLANWLHHEICTVSDPSAALFTLDRLHQAFNQPGSLIDAMIAVAISSIRNETYLQLQLLGRLPQPARDRWLAEQNNALQWVAAGFDGERSLFLDSLVNWIEHVSLSQSFSSILHDGNLTSSSITPFSLKHLYAGPHFWATMQHDAAICTTAMAQVSARLRHERKGPMPDYTLLRKSFWGYGAMVCPNLIESAITALESDANHRLFRIAVRILDQAPKSGLPIDETALLNVMGDPKLLTPSGDHLHLAYEHLAPDRFRLTVSPTSPIPDFDDPSRLKLRSKAFGTPASKNPYANDRTSIEIQLPKRLQPVQVTP